jgi:hypothetical protein
MGWGFRKSASVGGLRFTFSKGGVSTSFGGKGLRFTSGPRGVYVTTGFGGFYYRQRLGGGRAPRYPSSPRPAQQVVEAESYATRAIASASVENLTDLSQDEFVSSLNEWTTRGALGIVSALAAVVGLVVVYSLGAANRLLVEVAVYGGIGMFLARFIENRRRRFLLMFDLGQTEVAHYQRLYSSLAELAASGRFRGVKLVGHHHDWKRNAGATRSLSFEPASLRLEAPPHIVTNLTPWLLSTQGMQLYFFPDRVLIRSRGRFAALSYEAIEVAADTSNFVWDESLPGDAQVIGETWLYVRRDGGPDRRFNGNRQIPIVRTAYVTLKSATGLEVVVQTTRISAAEDFVKEGRNYARSTVGRGATTIPSAIDPEVSTALAVLGLAHVPSHSDLKRTYRELALRNHPDRFTRESRDIRLFAEQRMKELNAAYELLLGHVVNGPTTGEESGGAPMAAADPSAASSSWRSAELLAVVTALLMAMVVFAVGRWMPVERPVPAPVRAVVAQEAAAPVAPPLTPAIMNRRILIACPLRTEPSPKAPQIGIVPKGTDLALIEKREGWWLVRDMRGHEGWTGPKCWQAIPNKIGTPARSKEMPAAAGSEGDSNSGQGSAAGRASEGPVDPYANSADAPPENEQPARKKPGLVDPFPASKGLVDPFGQE